MSAMEMVTGCGVFRADNGNTIWQLSSCSQTGWFAPAPRVGDFSPASPGKEIVLGASYSINRPISMFAGITGNLLWSFSMASLNHTAEGISIGDIDNDGCVEIVVAPDCCIGDPTVLALDDAPGAANCGILASIGQVDFLPNDTTACSCANFRDFSSLCATDWNWSFPGGTPSTSTLKNPGSVCYATSGPHIVTMIAHLNACAIADTVIHTITICSSSTLAVSATPTNVLCNGQCNGTATANTTGGTAGYNYLWSGGQTTAVVSGLCAGTYTLTVTDASSNTVTTSVTITPPGAFAITASATNSNCGQSDGSATTSITAGTGPYTYVWSNAGNTQTISNITAGNYSVTVTGAGGCTATASATVQSSSAVTLSQNSTPASCNNNNGSATVTVTAGTGPFTYAWSNAGNTSTISNVAGGTYTVTVTGAGGCTATASAIVQSSSAVTLSQNSTPASCNNFERKRAFMGV